jgi:hypothetical protein
MKEPVVRRSRYSLYYLSNNLVDYNIMAPLNTNNYECCYKERKRVEKIKKIKPVIIKKELGENFKKINIKPDNLINGKLPKLVKKYQNKPRVNKIPKL